MNWRSSAAPPSPIGCASASSVWPIGPTVSVDEHCLLIKTVVEHVRGRVHVMAGVGGNATSEAIELTKYAKSVGADERGMRRYVFVLLKTGPNKVPEGPARDEMFKGHFANIGRLAAEGKLVQAGPFDGVDGWRGMFVLAVADIDEARRLVATDPVIASGEMVAEYHRYYGSAALMLLNEAHRRVEKPAQQ